jgi:hypothetical protein
MSQLMEAQLKPCATGTSTKEAKSTKPGPQKNLLKSARQQKAQNEEERE